MTVVTPARADKRIIRARPRLAAWYRREPDATDVEVEIWELNKIAAALPENAPKIEALTTKLKAMIYPPIPPAEG